MVTQIDDQSFITEVEEKKGFALVDFWAVWCGPCRSLSPTIEALSEKYEGKVRFYKANIDETGSTASKLAVMSIPTVIIFKDGEPVKTSVGNKPMTALVAFIDETIA